MAAGFARGAPGAIAALALGLFFAEFALRAAVAVSPALRERITGQPARPHQLHDRQLVFRPNPAHPDHDARGFRNPRGIERADVVTLGDSQTYGMGVERAQAWPAVLGEQTGIAVYNMAFGGWGPVQSLLMMEQALPLHPRVVIAGFYGGNDLYDAFALVYDRGALPELRSSDPRVAEAIARAEAQQPLVASVEAMFFVRQRRGFLERHSLLLSLARRTARSAFEASGLRGSGWDGMRASCLRSREDCEVFEGETLRTLFTPGRRWLALDPDDPRIREGERIAVETLVRSDAQLRRAGGRLLVLGIPTKERAFAESGLVAENASETFRRLVGAERALNERMTAALAERGVVYVDSAPALARALASGERCYRESKDGHPSPEGHRVLASLVAPLLGTPR